MLETRQSIPCLVAGVLVAAICTPSWGKPTREQIVAYADECKSQQRRMNLVETFGTDFSNLDLSGVDFRGVHAVDYETLLVGADFSGCNLRNAEFGGSIVDRANFSGADLSNASFVTASLEKAILTNVTLAGTKFYQSDLSGAKLAGANLSKSDITGSNFANADLSNAVLSGAKSEYWWNDFRNANLSHANMRGIQLNGGQFQNANLRSADLSDAQLIQANFSGADLTDTNFKDANVESAVFTRVRGLDDESRRRLEDRAERWKFDVKQGISQFLTAAYFPSYFLVIVALVALSIREKRSSRSTSLSKLAVVINIIVLFPALAMVLMTISGASPTVQFNAGSESAMQAWSMWVGIWPILMIVLLACLAIAVILAIAFSARKLRWRTFKDEKWSLMYFLLTICHCLFASHWIGSNFPSA